MAWPESIALAVAFAVLAGLYASVGQAGASGYLAALMLAHAPAALVRPTALVLNIAVAAVGTLTFARAGAIKGRALLPLAVASVPMAFIGGRLNLAPELYRPVVGGILVIAAVRLLISRGTVSSLHPAPVWQAALTGGAIGLVSGLTGIGGGIFLTPLMLFVGWADAREAAGLSAAFILLNSIAALLAQPASLAGLPEALPVWMACAVLGGGLGARYGAQRLSFAWTRRILAGVLLLAAMRSFLA